MKGLFIKDIALMKHNKRLLMIIFFDGTFFTYVRHEQQFSHGIYAIYLLYSDHGHYQL